MNCIDLTLKRSKMFSYVPNHSKHSKTTKGIKLRWIASIWRKNDKKCCYVPNHSKHSKTTKVIKLQWIASIWCQKHQTTQNYKSDQITMNCIDLTLKRSKMFSYVPNHSKHKVQTTKVANHSNYDELHRFDVKTIKNVELRPKPFQTQQNYKSDQITMNCIDLTLKRSKMFSYVPNHSKQLKPTKVIKLQWIASIWCQKHQTTQNYKSDQITMKCMDLTSKRTKMLSYVANHSKQRKLQK